MLMKKNESLKKAMKLSYKKQKATTSPHEYSMSEALLLASVITYLIIVCASVNSGTSEETALLTTSIYTYLLILNEIKQYRIR